MDRQYVIFTEFSNVETFFQFVDYSYGDKICDTLYKVFRDIKREEKLYRFQQSQYVLIGTFDKKEKWTQSKKENHIMERIKDINKRFYGIFTGKEDIILTYGGACNGIKREAGSIKGLIQLAQYTMVEAKKKHMMSMVADEIIRSEKIDLDDFVLAFDYYFDINEFTPFFQPIVDKHSLKIIGCESLIRWRKDEYRIISAGRFKDIAVEKKYFDVIDKSVIRKSFETYKHWRENRLIRDGFLMVINLSLHTLSVLNVRDLIKLTVYFDIDPHNIEFDVDDYIDDDSPIFDKIQELKDAGFRVAVDAFHYQRLSMTSFLHFDVDTIKIDKSVLPQDAPDDRHVKLYEAITKMSGTLDAKTLIKGIENKYQMQMALNLAVDYLQGYYFTKPVDEEQFALYLKKHANGFA